MEDKNINEMKVMRNLYKDILDIFDRLIDLGEKEIDHELTEEEKKEIESLTGRMIFKSIELNNMA